VREPSAAPIAPTSAAATVAASDDVVAAQELPTAGAAPAAGSPGPTAIAAAQLNPVRDPIVRAAGPRARARSHRVAVTATPARKPSMAGSGVTSSAPPQAAASQPAATSTASDTGEGEQSDVAPSLRRELTLIAAAQAALARNAPDEALRWLDAHAAGYASGALVQERLAARAVALCALGRDAEGRRAAGDLARLAPHSPLLGRARRACAADSP
jgi:hypothetical protein